MMDVLITLLVCGTVAGVWVRAEALLHRTLALRESEAARLAQLPDKVRIPGDLLARADAESEPWAKEQFRALLREAFEESGNWDDVRARLA